MSNVTRNDDHSNSIANMSDQKLLVELKTAFDAASRAIGRAATIWMELKKRGVPLDQYNIRVGPYLEMVAAGDLLPEVLSRYLGNVTILRAVSQMSQDDQRTYLLSNEAVEYWDGATVQQRTVGELNQNEVLRVIQHGRVRPSDEQRIAWERLDAERDAVKTNRPQRGRPLIPTVDQGYLTIGGKRARVEDVLSALRDQGVI